MEKHKSMLLYYGMAGLLLLLAVLYGIVHIKLWIIGMIAAVGLFLILRLEGQGCSAYYGTAILTFAYALVYRYSHADAVVTFAGLTIMLSTAALLSGVVFKRKEKLEAVPISFAPPDETDGAVKAALQNVRSALASMDELIRSIKSEKVVGIIGQLRGLCKKILDEVEASPEKLPKIRGFMQLYLPTTVKILQSYRHAEATGIEGANISDLKRQIESMLDPPILNVFHKQLDSLFGDEVLDISTDIAVLQNMLAQEGLYGEKLGTQADSLTTGSKF